MPPRETRKPRLYRAPVRAAVVPPRFRCLNCGRPSSAATLDAAVPAPPEMIALKEMKEKGPCCW